MNNVKKERFLDESKLVEYLFQLKFLENTIELQSCKDLTLFVNLDDA